MWGSNARPSDCVSSAIGAGRSGPDRPGVGGVQQLGETLVAEAGLSVQQLGGKVRARRASGGRSKDADRRRAALAVDQPAEREGQARILAKGVVNQQRVLTDRRDRGDLQISVGTARDTELAFRAEADRRSVLERDYVRVARLLLAQG